jgi:hypothetical protein
VVSVDIGAIIKIISDVWHGKRSWITWVVDFRNLALSSWTFVGNNGKRISLSIEALISD